MYPVTEFLFTLPRNGQRTSNLFFKILGRDGSVEGNLKRIKYVWYIDIMARFFWNQGAFIFFQCNKLTLCLFPLWIRWSIPSGFVSPQPIVFDRKTMAEKCNDKGLKSSLSIQNRMMNEMLLGLYYFGFLNWTNVRTNAIMQNIKKHCMICCLKWIIKM